MCYTIFVSNPMVIKLIRALLTHAYFTKLTQLKLALNFSNETAIILVNSLLISIM